MSNSGGLPVSSGSGNVTIVTTGSNAGATQAGTIISGAQATRILAQLQRSAQGQQLLAQANSSSAQTGVPTTIGIQSVQTNPNTGVRQIIAIPIPNSQNQSSGGSEGGVIQTTTTSGGGRISISPMKAGATSSHHQPFGPHVKVVRVSAAGAGGQQPLRAVAVNSHQQLNVGGSGGATTVHVLQQQQQQQIHVANSFNNAGSGAPSPSSSTGSVAASLNGNGKRGRSDIGFGSFGAADAERRKTEKGGKGLRHFSMKVCEKVQAKGTTSYNEVADELVAELTDPTCTSPTDQQFDQKNIRRRVYDALNVLMAMNIISKEKKEIRWLGLPTNSIQEAHKLELDKSKSMERIKGKTQQLQDLILQQIAFKNLVERNKQREKTEGVPPPNSAIQLPFIIVNTSKKTVIDCSISNDKMEYLFNFDDTFEIHDDMEVLKRMGLSYGLEHGSVSEDNLSKARQMVPRALVQYVDELAVKGPAPLSNLPVVSDPVPLLPDSGSSGAGRPRISQNNGSVRRSGSNLGAVADEEEEEEEEEDNNLEDNGGLFLGRRRPGTMKIERDSEVDFNWNYSWMGSGWSNFDYN